jgi:hypothetical protein
MNNLSHGLSYRLAWSIFATVLLSGSVRDYLATRGLGALVMAFAWLLIGISWFMQPVVFGGGMRETIAHSAQYAIGSKYIRNICISGGGLLLWTAQVLKFSCAA